jgi:hypothetical protein
MHCIARDVYTTWLTSARVAALCSSTEMRNHYLQVNEHYTTLAEAEKLSTWTFPISRLRLSMHGSKTDCVLLA